ncbi:MAG: universal stress protein [Henriciella sp.]|nr:universal stress protein [Henriciella sp.]
MDYKTIFAPFQFIETAQVVMESSIVLATKFRSHIRAQHIRTQAVNYAPYAFHAMSMSTSPAIITDQFEAANTEYAEKLKAIFDTCCRSENRTIVAPDEAGSNPANTASWSDTTGPILSGMVSAGRVSDVSVLAMPDASSKARETPLLEALLMESGRPVLIVPRSGLKKMPQNVVVAWDGSLPATRAVHAAMPFLSAAKQVTVTTVGSADGNMPTADQAANFLKAHGISVQAKTVDWPKKPIAERILNQADATNSDLVVMGGYSHARFLETLLGGTTRHMLDHADRALLLAH